MDNVGFSDDIEKQKNDINKNKIWTINNNVEQKIYTFNEAVTLAGNGRFHKVLLIICGFCMMAVMTEIMGLSLLIPIAKCDLKFSLNEQSILASSGFLGVVASSHIMGFLSDTWGRLKVLRISILISSICSIISAFSVNVWMLSIFRFLVGFFISSCQACNYSYLGEFHGNKTRTRGVTLLSTFIPLAFIFMPAIAALTLPLQLNWYIFNMNFTSWRIFILCNGIPGYIALFILPFFPESPRYLLVQGRKDEALQVLQTVYSYNTGLSKNDYPVKEISTEISGSSLSNVKTISDGLKLIWYQTIPLFYKERIWQTMNFLIHSFVIFAICQGTFMWFPGIVNGIVGNYDKSVTVCQAISKTPIEIINSTTTTTTIIQKSNTIEENCPINIDLFMYEVLAVMGFAYTLVYLFFAFSINKIGKKRLLVIWMVAAGSSAISLVWSKGFYLNMILLTCMMAVGNCTGIVNTMSMEFFPTNINAMAMCLLVMVGRLGSSAGSSLIGWVLVYDCNILFYGTGISIYILVCFALVLPVNKNKS